MPGKKEFCIVGVDLAQDKFDTYCNGEHRIFPHNKLGLVRFRSWLDTLRGRIIVAYESTGYLSRPFTRTLMDMGVEWRCLPPSFIRSYAKAMGINAKSDKADARVIVEYAQAKEARHPVATTRKRLDLQELEALRQLYIRQCAHFKTAWAAYRLEEALGALRETIAQLEEKITLLEQQIDAAISEDKELKARKALYEQEPGIGPKTARTLVIQMPELGTCSGKQMAALAGLAPFEHSSGNMDAPRHIRRGRKTVRTAMYMAAIAVRRCRSGDVKDFYLRLKAQGKANKVIAIACARKMLLRLNAAARDLLERLEAA